MGRAQAQRGGAGKSAALIRTETAGQRYTDRVIRSCAVALLAGVLAASDPPIPPVRLDVVVTNANGAPILDLRPGDFELRENGVARPIGSVELRAPSAVSSAEIPPITSPDDAQRAARAPGTRVFAFVLDEFHVTPGPASERVRASMSRFIESHLRPVDLAVAIKPLDLISAIRFTRDRMALASAIASFTGRKGDYAPRSTFEAEYIGHAPSAIDAARTQIVSAALREVALRLGELGADRGVVVLVSEGFERTPPGRQLRVPDLQGLVRAASRFHLALYAFNPADKVSPAEPDAPLTTLQWLATQTGGQAILDGAAFDAGLRGMASDLDSYYAVTYQPAQADGRFHAIELVAKRKNAQVRARPGYWATLGTEMRALMDVPVTPVSRRALRRSTAINVWTGISLAPGGGTRMTVTWERRGPQPAQAVLVKAATSDGKPLFDGRIQAVGADPGQASATFDVPPGRVELDMSILAMTGAVLDSDVRDVDVPPLPPAGKAPLILTPEIVRGRTTPEFRALASASFPAPTPSRAFSRGDRLLIRVPVWDGTGGPVQVTAIVANAAGGVMRAIERADGPDAHPARFDLPLAWLAPGAYQLVFNAKNATGETRESVRFAVR